jgi:hypothetical protein
MMAASWSNGETDVAIPGHWRSKHVSTTKDADTTKKGTVFSMQSVMRLYNEDQLA